MIAHAILLYFFFLEVMGSQVFRIASTTPSAQHPIVIQIGATHPRKFYHSANGTILSTTNLKTFNY